MTLSIALLLLLIILTTVLLAFEWVPADVVALGLLIVLVLTGLLPAEKAFLGFGSDTAMMILGLLIMTSALMRTGVVDWVGRTITRRIGARPNALLLVVMLASAGLGAFMSNTASTAFFVPVVLAVAKKSGIAASKLLMPLAFASILTSSVSLISTSTNLVVNGLMTSYGLKPMGMFEMAPVGIPIAVVGLIYMFFIGRRLIPDRGARTELIEEFGIRPFLTEVVILPDSPLVGKTLETSAWGRKLDLAVLRIVREKGDPFFPRKGTVLRANDVLLVEGKREEILKVKDTDGIEIKADVKLSDPNLESEDSALVEAILMPRSPLVGRTLKGYGFRERFGLQVLGLNRHGQNVEKKISQIPLRVGDVLLLQGHKANIASLEADHTFRILGAVEEKRPNERQALTAVGIFAGALVLATTNFVSMPIAFLIGAILIFLTHCITPEEAYREVEWRVIILIGCMLGLGVAMDNTGTATYLAGWVVNLVRGMEPAWGVAGFFVLTVMLTQLMSNQAAAVVILPIAIQTALQLGYNPRAFAITVAVAASCSYLTPLEPACLMVYGPGRYRFADFLKVGSILTVLIGILAVYLIPRYWPLQ